MLVWVRDHVLPGVLIWLITGAFPFSHIHLLKRLRRVTAEQTAELKSGSEDGKAKP